MSWFDIQGFYFSNYLMLQAVCLWNQVRAFYKFLQVILRHSLHNNKVACRIEIDTYKNISELFWQIFLGSFWKMLYRDSQQAMAGRD